MNWERGVIEFAACLAKLRALCFALSFADGALVADFL